MKKKLNCSIGKKWKKREKFDKQKFWSGFSGLLDPVGWAKDFMGLFNVRKLVTYAVILGFVASYFYVQGRGSKPVKIDIGYGKEAILEVNKEGDHVYIAKDGSVYFRDKDGNILRQLTVKDIPGLKKKLAPVGFQLKPIGIMGTGFGLEGIAFEGGAGISFLRYWKMEFEAFLTNRGIYLGTSYKITDNSNIGLGAGKGYKGDNRMILYYRWKF